MRLIDADALDEALTALRFTADGELAHWGDRKDWCLHGSEIEMLIANAPTIDAVEVVRCKDCMFRLHLGPTEHYPETYVCRIDNVSGTRKAYRDEWFCADGERGVYEDD